LNKFCALNFSATLKVFGNVSSRALRRFYKEISAIPRSHRYGSIDEKNPRATQPLSGRRIRELGSAI
jgi:hypothetical protein